MPINQEILVAISRVIEQEIIVLMVKLNIVCTSLISTTKYRTIHDHIKNIKTKQLHIKNITNTMI